MEGSAPKAGKRRHEELGETSAPPSEKHARRAKDADAPADADAEAAASKSRDKEEEDSAAGPLAPIATPLAGRKLVKRLMKLVARASTARLLRRGVKEVVKALRKGEKGLVVLAGDISPYDVLSHVPVLAEDAESPYVFVPGKAGLGKAAGTKRPTSCVLVPTHTHTKGRTTAAPAWDGAEKLPEIVEEIKAIGTA